MDGWCKGCRVGALTQGERGKGSLEEARQKKEKEGRTKRVGLLPVRALVRSQGVRARVPFARCPQSQLGRNVFWLFFGFKGSAVLSGA